jgi:hypothetical protein
VVIVGRGGPILLADIEHAMRVRTNAPFAVREGASAASSPPIRPKNWLR